MTKDIIFHEDSRNKLLKGVEKLANAVRLTLGAKGRNVIIKQKFGSPIITNDGVTIAQEVHLKDKFENIGADIVKEVASNSNNKAGDGTTTATILTHAIFKEGLRYISQGCNAMSIKEGINKAVKTAIKFLKEGSVKIDTEKQKQDVAFISSQDKEVASVISKMIAEVGDDGVVTVQPGNNSCIETEIVKGLQLSEGWCSPHLITDTATARAEYDNVSILVTDCKLEFTQDILPLLQEMNNAGNKNLVILAFDGAKGQMLSDLVLNKRKGNMSTLVVKVPGFGQRKKDLLKDLSIAVGANYISAELGMSLEKATISDLGRAVRVTAERDKTVILEGGANKQELKERVDQIKMEIKNTESEYEKEKMQQRLGRLVGGIGIIKVGALTEGELSHRLHRVEDSLEATKAAISEGVVKGGGVALVEVSEFLSNPDLGRNESERIGYKIISKALLIPARQIVENAGVEGGEIISKIKDSGLGYDVNTNSFVNMLEAGIIDPVKVTISALENAASAASMLLTTECAIAYEEKE